VKKKLYKLFFTTITFILICTISVSAEEITLVDDKNPSIVYLGTWWDSPDFNSIEGGHRFADSLDAAVVLDFYGTGIKWISPVLNNTGLADVYIDGVKDTSVDTYSRDFIYQRIVYEKSNLDRKNHTIEVKATGNKSPLSYGKFINIDAFVIIDNNDTESPGGPLNISANGLNNIVEIDWQDNTEIDIEGYNVYRSILEDQGYERINNWLITDGSYFKD